MADENLKLSPPSREEQVEGESAVLVARIKKATCCTWPAQRPDLIRRLNEACDQVYADMGIDMA